MVATRRWLVGLLLVVVSGCATTAKIPVERLQDYQTAFGELRAGVKAAIAFEREWAYDNYMKALETDGRSPSNVILQFPAGEGHPFAWSLPDAPIFSTLQETEAKLARVNGVFAQYTSLLVTLAGGGAEDSARIEKLAGTLNENSRSAGSALGLDVDAQGVALFSTAAAAAAKAYLKSQRVEHLRAVLEANQPAVEQFARLGAEAAELSAIGIHDEYQDSTQRWIARVIAAPPERRAELVKEQLARNRRTITQLKALRKIRDAYRKLGEAHGELTRSLGAPDSFSVQGLVDDVREAQRLYDRLKGEGADKSEDPSG